jgi:hypothetical protein
MTSPTLSLIETEEYKGPDRRAAQPLKAYDKTVINSEARLPPITDLGRGIVALAVNNMAPKEVAVLALHLNHATREASINRSREAAEGGSVAKGDHVKLVRVSTVSSKYEGMVGVVSQVANVRCYVKVKGIARPFYVYMAEVEKMTAAQYKKVTGTAAANDGASTKRATTKGATKASSTKPAKKASAKKSGSKPGIRKAGTKRSADASESGAEKAA